MHSAGQCALKTLLHRLFLLYVMDWKQYQRLRRFPKSKQWGEIARWWLQSSRTIWNTSCWWRSCYEHRLTCGSHYATPLPRIFEIARVMRQGMSWSLLRRCGSTLPWRLHLLTSAWCWIFPFRLMRKCRRVHRWPTSFSQCSASSIESCRTVGGLF